MNLSIFHKYLKMVFIPILLLFTNLTYGEEVLNPQVLISGVNVEVVKSKIIERALSRNLSLDSESSSKVIVSYEFSGKGEGYRRVRLGVDSVRDEIVYLLAPVSGGVKVYARLFISGTNRNGQVVRMQLSSEETTELFGGQTFGEKLQVELNQLKVSFE